jgi:nucleoside transporter
MSDSATLDPILRFRLSLMMFIQYAVWGAWFPVLSKYIGQGGLNFEGSEVGWVYATTAIASIISPIIFGQIADRWVPTQIVLGFCHLAGAVPLYFMTSATGFAPFFWLTLVHTLLYMPTLSLTNALAMHHMSDPGRHFPGIRVLGTIGWIAVGLFVGVMLNESSVEPLYTAMALSLVMGLYSLTLPHTPPSGTTGEALPFVRAFGLIRAPMFLLFMVVSFIIAVVLAGYFTWTAPYLVSTAERLDFSPFAKSAAAFLSIGQATEIIFLLLLPFLLKRFGMKYTLLFGMAAWGLRYVIFAWGGSVAAIILAIALHGICYDFFFVAGYIYVDRKAGKEIRASAQALFNLVTLGLGMFVGNVIIFGRLVEHYTVEGVTQWSGVWLWPCIGAALALAIFWIGFHDREAEEPAAAEAES